MRTGERREPAGSGLCGLAFWSKNMISLRATGAGSWPGFTYSDAEWERMDELSGHVGDGAYGKFVAVTAVAFIALAALGIFGAFLPVASALFPATPAMKPLPFVLLLAATAFALIGLGLPIAMRVGEALSADDAMRASLVIAPGDAQLASKIVFQIRRMAAIMCGVFVPGTLLWIAFNIQATPVVTALKWVAIAAMAAAIAYARMARPKQP